MTSDSGGRGVRLPSRDVLHLITLSTSVVAFVLVQLEVPEPYLDEIFHIPQTQQYCRGDFKTWDPAITTPPGLYLVSVLPLMVARLRCSPTALRLTNLICSAVVIPFLISLILESAESGPRRRIRSHFLRPSSEALVISSFPLVFFFGNLYYTDVASLAAVLGIWCLSFRRRHWAAALAGVWSVTIRQTNVVWIAFFLATSLLRLCDEHNTKAHKDDIEHRQPLDPFLRDVSRPIQVLQAILSCVQVLARMPRRVFTTCLPYTLPIGGFLAFLRWNGGVVLGHKDRHEAVLHLPQILYFIAFATIFLAPTLLDEGVRPLLRSTLRMGTSSLQRVVLSFGVAAGAFYAVHKYTMFHPFLLADNRHYVFYALRWVLIPYPLARYALVPVYVVAFWAWVWRLRRHVTLLWSLGFLASTAIVLVPSPLIEPRYFLIPTVILRIVAASPQTRIERTETLPGKLIWEYLFYAIINAATVGLFLTRKFRWEGWEGWMRFMW